MSNLGQLTIQMVSPTPIVIDADDGSSVTLEIENAPTNQVTVTGVAGPPGVTQPFNVLFAGNSGTAQTLPPPTADQMVQYILTANCVITTPSPIAGLRIIVVLTQDSTGGRQATWNTVNWGLTGAPVLSVGAGKRDYITLVCVDGTHWDGFASGYGF